MDLSSLVDAAAYYAATISFTCRSVRKAQVLDHTGTQVCCDMIWPNLTTLTSVTKMLTCWLADRLSSWPSGSQR